MIQRVDRVKQGHDRRRAQINMIERQLNDLYAVIQLLRHAAPLRHDQIFRVVKNIDQTVTALILMNCQTTRVVKSYGFFVGQSVNLQDPVIGIAVIPVLSAVAAAPGQDGSQQAQNQKKYETVSALPFLSHVCYPFFVLFFSILFFSILFFSILFFFIMIPAVAAKSTMTAAIAAYKNAFA